MTREDLYDWLKIKGCTIEQIDGINTTGNQIKIRRLHTIHHKEI